MSLTLLLVVCISCISTLAYAKKGGLAQTAYMNAMKQFDDHKSLKTSSGQSDGYFITKNNNVPYDCSTSRQ